MRHPFLVLLRASVTSPAACRTAARCIRGAVGCVNDSIWPARTGGWRERANADGSDNRLPCVVYGSPARA